MILDAGGGNTITLMNPMWGYSVEHGLNLHVTRTAGGKYRLFDCGAAYDAITCRCTVTDTADVMGDFADFQRLISRGQPVSIALGVSSTGFFPAGPNRGDLGTFTATITASDPSGWLCAPWGYVEADLVITVTGVPAYALPAQVSEGSFQIGSVSGLRWPYPGFKPVSERGYGVDLSRDGTAYPIDMGTSRDIWTTEWRQMCGDTKAAALAAYLIGAGRGADTTIVTKKNGYLFGTDNAESDGHGTYTANLINGNESGSILAWKHNRYNEWEINLKYWLQTFTPEPS